MNETITTYTVYVKDKNPIGSFVCLHTHILTEAQEALGNLILNWEQFPNDINYGISKQEEDVKTYISTNRDNLSKEEIVKLMLKYNLELYPIT